MKRRNFLRTLAIGSVLPSAASTLLVANEDKRFQFEEPFDGAILHERHGKPVVGVSKDAKGKKSLIIEVTGTAPAGIPVDVIGPNGKIVHAERQGNRFSAKVTLLAKFSVVTATCTIDGQKKTIKTQPVWIPDSFKRYRFQIDDSSFFLRDIHQKNYKSIFECFWLEGLRKLNKQYGTKFVVNCFYSTPKEDFNLSMMSDKYKSEWNDNAEWLRLAFHAKNEFPNKPYENATPEQLAADFDLVNYELKRIAANAFSPPGIVHWGTAKPESHHVFRDRGTRALSGYFTKAARNAWSVAWQLPDPVCEYLSCHDGWYDRQTDLVFSRLDIVCNTVPLDKTLPKLEAAVANPATAEVLDYLTHEQYFWPFYSNYLPDHFKRLDAAIRFATDRGYQPVWHNEGFYSVPD